MADFVSKYKKQCLLRKTQFREMQEKFDSEKPTSGETLMVAQMYAFFFNYYYFYFKINLPKIALVLAQTQGRLGSVEEDLRFFACTCVHSLSVDFPARLHIVFG